MTDLTLTRPVIPFCVFQVRGYVAVAEPYSGCAPLNNAEFVAGRIALLQRGQCMFAEKARNIQKAGAIGGIVIGETHGAFRKNSVFKYLTIACFNITSLILNIFKSRHKIK